MRMLSADPEVESVRIVTRRPLNVDLQAGGGDRAGARSMEGVVEKGASVFSCIGTTQRKVKGDRDAYRKIDHAITEGWAGLPEKEPHVFRSFPRAAPMPGVRILPAS